MMEVLVSEYINDARLAAHRLYVTTLSEPFQDHD